MPQNHTAATAMKTIPPVFALLLFSTAFAQPPTTKQLKRKNYLEIFPAPHRNAFNFSPGVRVEFIEQMPMYPNGIQGLVNFVAQKTRYVLNGRTVLKFLIDVDGKVKNVEVLETSHEPTAKEIARILEKTDNWQPALVNGAPKAFSVQMPFHWKTKQEFAW